MSFADVWNRGDFWRRALGLSPVPLHPTRQDQSAYVLLNGSHGNFCLDVQGDSVADGRSAAWSSDVGHFVSLKNDIVSVQHWNRIEALPVRFAAIDVANNLQKFHAYLEGNEPNRDQSIIVHALRVVGQMRVCLGADTPSDLVMSHFLALLQMVFARQETVPVKEAMPWLTADDLWEDRLKAGDWDALRFSLSNRRAVSELQPEIGLLLRHASGPLFQEVHHCVSVTPTSLTLPGIPPLPPKRTSEKSGRDAGTFFTPPALARTLVEEAFGALGALPNTLKIFDPACGSSEFLKESIRYLEARGYRGTVELIGWDILDASVQMSRFSLELEAASDRTFEMTFRIEKRNSLDQGAWPKDVTLLLMNPPFRSLVLMTTEEREQVQRILGASGRPNLAAAFVMRATEVVAEGGVLAFVAPASISDADSSRNVREALADIFTPVLLAKLGNQNVFTSATVDAGIYVGVRGDTRAKTRPARLIWADHGPSSLSSALRNLRKLSDSDLRLDVVDEATYSIYPDREAGRSGEVWRIKPYHAVRLLEQSSRLPKLGELFDVKQGARPGQDVLVQPLSYITTLPAQEQEFFRPAVMNATLRNSVLLRRMYSWFPYGSEYAIQNEHDLQRRVPKFFEEKLLPAKPDLLKRRAQNVKWWELIRARTWQYDPSPKIVTTYFGDKGSVAYDSVGDFVVIVGHCWQPKKILRNMSDAVAFAYVAIAASDIFGELLHAVSVHIGGGQLNLEGKHIANLPLPNLTSDHISLSQIRKLTKFGEQLSQGSEIDVEGLNSLVARIYGR